MYNEQISKVIGDNIKTLREGISMTQTQLAEKLGVSKQIISAYEKGVRSPSYEILMKIKDVFSVDINELLYQTIDINKIMIDLSGLNNAQVELVKKMVDEFKELNKKSSNEDYSSSSKFSKA